MDDGECAHDVKMPEMLKNVQSLFLNIQQCSQHFHVACDVRVGEIGTVCAIWGQVLTPSEHLDRYRTRASGAALQAAKPRKAARWPVSELDVTEMMIPANSRRRDEALNRWDELRA